MLHNSVITVSMTMGSIERVTHTTTVFMRVLKTAIATTSERSRQKSTTTSSAREVQTDHYTSRARAAQTDVIEIVSARELHVVTRILTVRQNGTVNIM